MRSRVVVMGLVLVSSLNTALLACHALVRMVGSSLALVTMAVVGSVAFTEVVARRLLRPDPRDGEARFRWPDPGDGARPPRP